MATMSFCGATGKMFRGQYDEHYRWVRCSEPEKPDAQWDSGNWKNNCAYLNCPLCLVADRRNNREPYRWGYQIQRGGLGNPMPQGVPVTGRANAEENRRKCGRIVRSRCDSACTEA